MTSREEKNKKYVEEINKEKTIKITKIIFKVIAIIILIFGAIFTYAHLYEPNRLTTHEYLITDSRIKEEFNGIKILHLTDILYGSTINQNKLEKIKDEIYLIKPDIIIFTGNIVSKEKNLNEEEIKYLNTFFSNMPYTIGKYAVIGDVDTHNFDIIMDNTNFTILNNELINIYNGKNKINMIGISYDTVKEIKNTDDDYTITIINNYDEYDKYNLTSDLVFAGHNLGGELRLFNIPLLGNDKHLDSYYEENNTKVYISNGLGSIHKLRLMNKPSMNVYRLYNK